MPVPLHDNRKPLRGKLHAPPSRVATDPRFPRDGVCVRDGCERPIPEIGRLNEDPFCSTVCCRLHYQVGD